MAEGFLVVGRATTGAFLGGWAAVRCGGAGVDPALGGADRVGDGAVAVGTRRAGEVGLSGAGGAGRAGRAGGVAAGGATVAEVWGGRLALADPLSAAVRAGALAGPTGHAAGRLAAVPSARGPSRSAGSSRGVVLVAILVQPAHADSGRRVALVIGNGAYHNAVHLPNPTNDAKAVAAALRRLDFEVIEAVDLDQPDMLAMVDGFSAELEGAETGLFFYAGHGLQVNGQNYLVPIDARLQREAQVKLQTLPLDTVLETM